MIPPVPDFGVGPVPEPGRVDEVAPGVVRLTAPNPGLMTGPGTNTYLIGRRELVVVDPGPADVSHTEAIVAVATPLGSIGGILVTHTHVDHAPGAATLAAATGAALSASARPRGSIRTIGPARGGRCPVAVPAAAASRCGRCTRRVTPRTICAGWWRSMRWSSRATTSCTARRS